MKKIKILSIAMMMMRKWATRSMITIDGEQRYYDWEDMEEECGTSY